LYEKSGEDQAAGGDANPNRAIAGKW